MSQNRKLSFAIGAFITGAIVLAFIAMLFFSGGRLFAQKQPVVMFFDGSVQGLQIGAPVKLKGVVIGEITDIRISFQSTEQDAANIYTSVVANLALQKITAQGREAGKQFISQAIDSGLRAQLNFQSLLTGLLYVELDFHPDEPANVKRYQSEMLEIPTIATNFEQLSAKIQNINIENLAGNINKLATDLSTLVESGEIQAVLQQAKQTLGAIEHSATELDLALAKTSSELNAGIKDTRRLVNRLNDDIPAMREQLQTSLAQLNVSLKQFEQASEQIDYTFSEDSAAYNRLNQSMQDISQAARALQRLSEGLDAEPDSLWRGREEAR